MLVKCSKILPGIEGSGRKFCYIDTYDGIEELHIDESFFHGDFVELPVVSGMGNMHLVEFPEESSRGHWRSYIADKSMNIVAAPPRPVMTYQGSYELKNWSTNELEGYISVLPQIGGKIIIEKESGDKVAFRVKDIEYNYHEGSDATDITVQITPCKV